MEGGKGALEQELFYAMQAARRSWLFAARENSRIRAEHREPPDGTRAVYRAARIEAEALQNYKEAIKAYAEFLIPEQNAG